MFLHNSEPFWFLRRTTLFRRPHQRQPAATSNFCVFASVKGIFASSANLCPRKTQFRLDETNFSFQEFALRLGETHFFVRKTHFCQCKTNFFSSKTYFGSEKRNFCFGTTHSGQALADCSHKVSKPESTRTACPTVASTALCWRMRHRGIPRRESRLRRTSLCRSP